MVYTWNWSENVFSVSTLQVLQLLMLESNETNSCECSLLIASGLNSGQARDRCGLQEPKSGQATSRLAK